VQLGLKKPGVCAFFEIMIDIVFKDVIGWDKKENIATSVNGGIFGKVNAVSMAIQEQGRRTLHAHILLWVEELKEMRSNL
jgi:hypothetical protein